MADAVIVSACRTPIGRFQGGLSKFRAPELGAMAIKEALSRAGVGGDEVEEVIMGTVLQAGLGQNPARQAALGAGVPPEVGSMTINKVCGSGPASAVAARRPGDQAPATPAWSSPAGMEIDERMRPTLLPTVPGRVSADGAPAGWSISMIHDGLWDYLQRLPHGHDRRARGREVATGSRARNRTAYAGEQPRHRAVSGHGRPGQVLPTRSFAVEVKDPQGQRTPMDERDEGIRARTPRSRRWAKHARRVLQAGRRDGHRGQRQPERERTARAALVVAERVPGAKELGLKAWSRTSTAYAVGRPWSRSG